MSEDTFARVKKITLEKLSVKEEEIVPDASFTEDLGADSLDVIEMVMEFEEEFKIQIPDDDVANIKTIGLAVKYIDSKTQA